MTAVKSNFGDHAATYSQHYGDWRLLEISSLDLLIGVDVFLGMVEYQEVVDFSEIAFKGMDKPLTSRRENCKCCDGKRYESCDTSFPGILVEGAPNPFNLKYRMVDGKHRIEKLISEGKTKSLFNIIKYERVKINLKPIVEQWEEDNRDSC